MLHYALNLTSGSGKAFDIFEGSLLNRIAERVTLPYTVDLPEWKSSYTFYLENLSCGTIVSQSFSGPSTTTTTLFTGSLTTQAISPPTTSTSTTQAFTTLTTQPQVSGSVYLSIDQVSCFQLSSSVMVQVWLYSSGFYVSGQYETRVENIDGSTISDWNALSANEFGTRKINLLEGIYHFYLRDKLNPSIQTQALFFPIECPFPPSTSTTAPPTTAPPEPVYAAVFPRFLTVPFQLDILLRRNGTFFNVPVPVDVQGTLWYTTIEGAFVSAPYATRIETGRSATTIFVDLPDAIGGNGLACISDITPNLVNGIKYLSNSPCH